MSETPPPAVRPAISAVEAAQQAFEHTRRLLFPFRFERWLALGFVSFLDQCGRGGGAPQFHVPTSPSGSDRGSRSADFAPIMDWVGSHALLIAAVAAVVLAAIVVLTALVLWLSSRGIFMYIDDVATGRDDVARPWREHKDRANSLFAFRFILGLATLLGVLLLVALGGALLIGTWKGRIGGPAAIATALLVLLPLLLLQIVASGLLSVALRDFVAPLQWQLGTSCLEAFKVLVRLVKAHPGTFGIYLLLKIGFSIASAVLVLVAGCLTCCCAFLPVVTQTLLQPLFFFERSWSLCILRQLGHDVLRSDEGAQLS